MEESYETLEEEFGAQRAEPLPQKPIRQIRRPGENTHVPDNQVKSFNTRLIPLHSSKHEAQTTT